MYKEQEIVIDKKNLQAKFGVIDYSGLVNEQGMPYGIGRAILHGNQVYEGQCLNDRAHGYGRIIYEHNEYYVGSWRDGLYNGLGKRVFQPFRADEIIQHGLFENHKFICEIED